MLLVSGIFLTVGFIFIIVYFAIFYVVCRKEKNCVVRTVGTVVDLWKEFDRDADERRVIRWFPVYEYYADGRRMTVKSFVGNTSKEKYQLGQKAELYYDPLHLDKIYVPKERPKLLANIFLILGIVLLLMGGMTSYLVSM